MRRKVWISFVVAGVMLAGVAQADPLSDPVVIDLGPLVPTPAPSPEASSRIRMITSFTAQNKPDGSSIISFEATDFARSTKKDFRILASEVYSMAEPKPEHRVMRDEILRKLRDLESDLLDYVEKVGPPRERQPITQQGGSQRPY